jgi:UDP:flavonoid glycosyltransferase YjiC (YdhE family)
MTQEILGYAIASLHGRTHGSPELQKLQAVGTELLQPHHDNSTLSSSWLRRVSDKRIVFAWELGTFLGHLERDLAVAQQLRNLGADVRFIVANLDTAEQLLAPAGFSFIPCPMLRRSNRRPKSAINFSELLLEAGYDDADVVRAAVRGWLELWKLLSPDVIVIDFAPTALLSARITGIPTLLMGPGFTVPPARTPMPAFRQYAPPLEADLRAADQKVLATINRVAASFDRSAFSSVAALFLNTSAQITSFAELDPFGPRADVRYVGPISVRGRFRREQWTRERNTRVFAYLQPTVIGLEVILAALGDASMETICVIPGAKEAMVTRFQVDKLRIFTEPLELDELLPDANVVVSYGSAGLVSSALQAGVPLLLFPKFLEQQMNSECATKLGAAVTYAGVPVRPKVKAALDALLTNRKYRQAAKAFATKYRNYRHEAAIYAVAETVLNGSRSHLGEEAVSGAVPIAGHAPSSLLPL